MIDVKLVKDGDPLEFEVTIRDENSESCYHVTINQKTCERLGGAAHTPERVLEAAFNFLLDREPKESILARFDVSVKTQGGGVAGQAGAVRHGIARALLEMDESLREALRKNGLLTRDPREKESKKYGRKRARKRFQFSKR